MGKKKITTLTATIVCIAMITQHSVHAQSPRIDSLERELSRDDISDSTRLQIYGEIIWPKTRSHSEDAIRLTDDLLDLSNRINSKEGQLSAYYYYGTTYKNQGKYIKALEQFEKYHDYFVAKNDTVQITNVLFQFAVIYEGIGDYTKSMDFYNQCITNDKLLGRQGSLAMTTSARATLFKQLNQLDKALTDHKEALRVYQSLNNPHGAADCLLNIGNTLGDLERYDEAFTQYDQADQIADSINYDYLKGHIYVNRGDILVKIEELDKAIDAYMTSLEIRKKLGRSQEVIAAENKIANVYSLLDRPREAVEIASSALDKGREQKILPQVLASLEVLAKAHKQMGAYQNALSYHEEYLIAKDSILDENITEQLAAMDAKFETSKKQSEIDQLSFESQLQSAKLTQQKWALLIAALVLAVLAFLLRNIYKKSNQIQKQKDQIAKSLTEKEFLLKEIHHRVKNNLQIISSLLKLQSQNVADQRAQLALDEGRNRVRSMAIIHQNLYQKDNLAGIAMKDYLDQLVTELLDSYKVDHGHIALDLTVEDIHLDVDTAVPIGLIVNELVSNSLKYAFPNQSKGVINIRLSRSDGLLHLQVGDDGIGFDDSNVSSSGFGHELVSAFAERLQADYELTCSDGTTATFRIKDFKIAA